MPTPLPEYPQQKLGSAFPFNTGGDDVPPHGGLFLVQITVLKECYSCNEVDIISPCDP